jgi:adenylate kinase family enzyme
VETKEILEKIYRSDELKECVSKIRPVTIQQDVLQCTFTELLLKDKEIILDLYARNKLMAYIAKMIYNMVRWERGSFRSSETKEILLQELPEIIDEQKNEIIVVPLQKIHWYEAKILELYAELGTYRKVAEVTGIPHISIYHTVQKARKNIKKHIDL